MEEIEDYIGLTSLTPEEQVVLLNLIKTYGDESHRWGYNWGVKDGEARECNCSS